MHNAYLALSAGFARHVLVYRTVTESTVQGPGRRRTMGSDGSRAEEPWSWLLPFGAVSAVNWTAVVAMRHFHEYGTTREQLGQIAVNGRRSAALNPKAMYREPISIEDYLAVRMISSPLCLYDCDAATDGSVAVVVSHADCAEDLPSRAVHVHALGGGLYGRPSWDQFDDMTAMASRDAARSMWNRTDLRPADVDCAQLYDGLTIITLCRLEALGFCGKCEAGPFLEGGERISRTGVLPLNTDGGQLSAGRPHGFGLLYEACSQLRGEAGDRHITAAEVAVVANGGGTTRWLCASHQWCKLSKHIGGA